MTWSTTNHAAPHIQVQPPSPTTHGCLTRELCSLAHDQQLAQVRNKESNDNEAIEGVHAVTNLVSDPAICEAMLTVVFALCSDNNAPVTIKEALTGEDAT
jgi:hypothetical protein